METYGKKQDHLSPRKVKVHTLFSHFSYFAINFTRSKFISFSTQKRLCLVMQKSVAPDRSIQRTKATSDAHVTKNSRLSRF